MAKTSVAHSSAASDHDPRPATTLPGASDIEIARAVADAVRATPVVLELSPGTVELAATYGPRERIAGVVVRRPNAHDVIIEVHVVLRGSLHDGSPQDVARGGATRRKASTGMAPDAVLTRSADQIRRAVYHATQRLDIAPPAGVDVLIEDIQVPT
jgi:hypothetical protein